MILNDQKRAREEKLEKDAYLTRLKNSADGFCGMRHRGDGDFLDIWEIRALIISELERRLKEIE